MATSFPRLTKSGTPTSSSDMGAPFLLDTHIWFWLLEGAKREIPPRIRRILERSGSQSGLVVSVISVWELAMLDARGRVHLSVECSAWVNRALTAPGVRLQGITPERAIESTRLPGAIHGDPVDRLLAATARVLGATLVTRDERLLEYGGTGHIKVLDASV